MSSLDIVQMFWNNEVCHYSFGIVISPRGRGVKAFGVCLTERGKAHLEKLCKEAGDNHVRDVDMYIRTNLDWGMKYCYQVPFETTTDPCTVAGF